MFTAGGSQWPPAFHLVIQSIHGARVWNWHSRAMPHRVSMRTRSFTRFQVSDATRSLTFRPGATQLDGWPMRSPVNASPTPSRMSAHDLGSVWIATPSP